MPPAERVILGSGNNEQPLVVELCWGIEKSDIPAVRRMHENCFCVTYADDYYNNLPSGSYLAILAFIQPANGLLSDKNNSTTSKATSASTKFTVLAGFCIGQLAHAQKQDESLLAPPTGYIGSFAVDARLRCRGLGDVLLRRFLHFMFTEVPVPAAAFLDATSTEQKGVSEVWLHCMADNEKLVQYYCKRGFTKARRIPNYYNLDEVKYDGMLLVQRANDLSSGALGRNATESSFLQERHIDQTCIGSSDSSNGTLCEVFDIDVNTDFEAARLQWQRRHQWLKFYNTLRYTLACGWGVSCLLLVAAAAWFMSTDVV